MNRQQPARTDDKRERRNILVDLHRNIQALAVHLCAYADVLRQCNAKSAHR